MSVRYGDKVVAGGASIRIDSQLSTTSVNPVQNKTITTAINTIGTTLSTKQDVISDLATIRSGATAGATAVQPGDLATVATTGQYSDLSGKPTTLAGYGITDGANTDLSNLTANGKETVVDLLTPDYTAGIDITSQVTGSGYTVLKDGIIYYFTMPATGAIDITVNGVYIMRKGSTSGNYSVSGSVIVKKNDVFWMGLVSGGSVYFYPFKGV